MFKGFEFSSNEKSKKLRTYANWECNLRANDVSQSGAGPEQFLAYQKLSHVGLVLEFEMWRHFDT